MPRSDDRPTTCPDRGDAAPARYTVRDPDAVQPPCPSGLCSPQRSLQARSGSIFGRWRGRTIIARARVPGGGVMRLVLQRVSRASVSIDGRMAGAIGRGFCLLVGFTHDDTGERVDWMADKVAGLRLFS